MMNARDERDELFSLICGRTTLKAVERVLAAGYRKPLTIDNEKLLIDDGLLLLDVGKCTCSPYGASHEPHCGVEYIDDLTKPLARAGYTKPRTVSTVAELDALPAESVVKGSNGQVFEKQSLGIWHDGPHDWQSFEGTFWDVDAILFPATILYEPPTPDAPTETGTQA